jgi:hypothetical protein
MSLPRYGDLVIDSNGRFSVPWFRFFERLSGKGPASVAKTLGVSPAVLGFTVSGFITVSGGTVSLIEYRRGVKGTFTNIGVTAGVVPVKNGDYVRITYTVAPTVTYFSD